MMARSPALVCSQRERSSKWRALSLPCPCLLVTPRVLVSASMLSGGDLHTWSVLSVHWGVDRPSPLLCAAPDVPPSAPLFLPLARPPHQCPHSSLGRSVIWNHRPLLRRPPFCACFRT